MPKYEFIHSLKKSIEESFFRLLPREYVGILEGMIIGDTSYISDDIKESFRNCGITHLLAVSGSNVTFVLLLCTFVFQKIFGRNLSNIFTIVFIIVFAILSGGSASVVRATIMTTFIILAELFAQKPNIYASISASAFIILLYNPLVLLDVGFILSFGGTLGIVLLSSKINNVLNSKFKTLKFMKRKIASRIILFIVETLSVTLSAQIIVTPISLYFFNTFSIFSIIVNIIVVPVTGFITILGIIIYFASLIFMPIARIISFVVYCLIWFVINTSKIFSALPLSSIFIPTPSIIVLLFFYLVVYYLFYCRGRILCDPKTEIADNCGSHDMRPLQIIICIIISIIIISAIIPNNHLKVNMVDVGQGDCIFIETPHHKTILVDTGGTEGSDYDIGEKVLVPYILDRGKTRIDYVFISHFHEDHAEGLLTLIDKLSVGKIIINEQKTQTELFETMRNKANNKGIEIIIIKEGDEIIIDDVCFKVLVSFEEMSNLNNTSVIMRMTYGEASMLFTGDAEKELEELVDKNAKSTILKVAHHGSTTSTTEDFLDKVKPQIALINVGVNNKFGHPKQEIIEKLQKRNIRIYRTDMNGEIYMRLYKNGKVKIKSYL